MIPLWLLAISIAANLILALVLVFVHARHAIGDDAAQRNFSDLIRTWFETAEEVQRLERENAELEDQLRAVHAAAGSISLADYREKQNGQR